MKFIIANINIIKILEDNKIESSISKKILNIYMSDNQFIIFSDTKITPVISIKNPIYWFLDNIIHVKWQKDKYSIKIEINKILSELIYDWEYWIIDNQLEKKEKDLNNEIVSNFNSYFPNIKLIKKEYITPLWNIDILWIDNNWVYHIFELKKRQTDINTISQVLKYWSYFDDTWKKYQLYVIWIWKNKKNSEYAIKNWINVINF